MKTSSKVIAALLGIALGCFIVSDKIEEESKKKEEEEQEKESE